MAPFFSENQIKSASLVEDNSFAAETESEDQNGTNENPFISNGRLETNKVCLSDSFISQQLSHCNEFKNPLQEFSSPDDNCGGPTVAPTQQTRRGSLCQMLPFGQKKSIGQIQSESPSHSFTSNSLDKKRSNEYLNGVNQAKPAGDKMNPTHRRLSIMNLGLKDRPSCYCKEDRTLRSDEKPKSKRFGRRLSTESYAFDRSKSCIEDNNQKSRKCFAELRSIPRFATHEPDGFKESDIQKPTESASMSNFRLMSTLNRRRNSVDETTRKEALESSRRNTARRLSVSLADEIRTIFDEEKECMKADEEFILQAHKNIKSLETDLKKLGIDSPCRHVEEVIPRLGDLHVRLETQLYPSNVGFPKRTKNGKKSDEEHINAVIPDRKERVQDMEDVLFVANYLYFPIIDDKPIWPTALCNISGLHRSNTEIIANLETVTNGISGGNKIHCSNEINGVQIENTKNEEFSGESDPSLTRQPDLVPVPQLTRPLSKWLQGTIREAVSQGKKVECRSKKMFVSTVGPVAATTFQL